MNSLCRLIVSITLPIALSHPAWAIQPLGQTRPSPASADSMRLVERGGTVNAIDLAKKTMVVDGVNYAIAATPAKIHALSSKPLEPAFELKAGMQIRFSTFKDPASGLIQAREIWVTSESGHSRPQ